MPTTDPHGDVDLIARVHDWLLSLWTDPEAAAQFAENPAVSLASNNLDQNALGQVNLRHVAGDVANAPGIPESGRNVLHSFANSPASSGSSSVREVFHVTREVHHDSPVIQKIFNDNSVHIDNSQTFINKGIIDGDISLDNNSATAIGHGAVAGAGGSTINAATGDGSVANQGDGTVNQASGHGQVIDGSEVGQNSANSPGSVQVGHDADGAVNTGAVHGTQAGGGATGNVTGNGNETATTGASADGVHGGGDPSGSQGDPSGSHGGPSNDHGGPSNDHSGDHGGPANIPGTGTDPVQQAPQDGSHEGGGQGGGHDGGIAFGQGHVGAASGNGAGGDGAASGTGGAGDQAHLGTGHGSGVAGHDGSGTSGVDAHAEVDTHTTDHVDHSHDVDLSADHSHAETDQHLKPVHVEADHAAVGGDDLDHHVLHA